MTGAEITMLRRSWKITQGTLAASLGVSRATVNAWENGRSRAPANIAERMATLSPVARAAEQRANDAQRRKEIQNQLAWYRYWREIISHAATMAKAPAPLYPETVAILTGEFADFTP